MVSMNGKSGGGRQPYLFEVGDGELFAFAGLCDQWKNPEGKVIESCTILTTTPNTLQHDIHDRIPVIVTPDQYDLGLSPEVEDFDAVREMRLYDPGLMAALSRKRESQFRGERRRRVCGACCPGSCQKQARLF
jgi:putative SOS response-associated peptidase YedK